MCERLYRGSVIGQNFADAWPTLAGKYLHIPMDVHCKEAVQALLSFFEFPYSSVIIGIATWFFLTKILKLCIVEIVEYL